MQIKLFSLEVTKPMEELPQKERPKQVFSKRRKIF
jgi:hypothetical protein